MPQINGVLATAAIDKLLEKDISGTWFFRNEMEEYMETETFDAVKKRLDDLYDQAVISNNGRAFNPKYRFHRVSGIDTQAPKVYLRLLMPGNHFNTAKLVGELILDLHFTEHVGLTITLPPEAPAEALAREQKWRASEAELDALNKLIEAARALQALDSKRFDVQFSVGKDGIKINTGYSNPTDNIRKLLAERV
jgi:hypothetical protein